MPIVLNVLLLILGFIMLVKGADWFVDGVAGLAGKVKIPELVVGLTVVAFGTSAPEFAVSVSSALKGSVDLTIGNVVGSNIINILLILGLSAVLCPLSVNKNLRRIDFPVLLGVSAIFIFFGAFDGQLDRWEGILMAILLVAYTVFLIVFGLWQRKGAETNATLPLQVEKTDDGEKGKFAVWVNKMKEKWWALVILTVVGLALIIFGADFAVNGATEIAKILGISERIIALTVVAIGTSLPELVTSVVASIKGKTDIAVGNIVGSNIFNILMVAGISSIVMPLPFSTAFTRDACIALGAAVILAVLGYLPFKKIERWGGIVLLLGAVGYFVYLFLLPA